MKLRKRTLTLWGLTFFLIACHNVAAQDWGTETASSMAAALRDGFRFEDQKWVIKPRFSFGAGYDQNVYLDENDTTSDYYYQFVPGVEFLYGTTSHNYFLFSYDYVDNRYFNESSEDHQDHRFQGVFHYSTGKTTLHIMDQYEYTYGANLEAGERLDRVGNVLSADMEHRVSEKTSLGMNGVYEIVDYDNNVYIDHKEYRAGLRMYYEALPKTDVFGEFAYGWVRPGRPRFNRRDLPGVPRDYSDAEYQEYSVGARYRATEKTRMIARVGYQNREFESDAIADLDTWTMAGAATTALDERTTIGVDASRRIIPSITESGHSIINTRLGGFVRRILWDARWSALLGVAHEKGNYYNENADKFRYDDYWSFTAKLNWRVSQYIGLGGTYIYMKNTSDADDRDTDRNIFMLNANVNY